MNDFQRYKRMLIKKDEAYTSFRDRDLMPGYEEWLRTGGASLPPTPSQGGRETMLEDIPLDEDEHNIATLIPDNPEQYYKHKNQIAAITNKRFFFVRYTGVATSFEGSYTLDSIDIHRVVRARPLKHFAVGGLMVGALAVLGGCVVAYMGATTQLVGPGVVFIPITVIPSGIALIFGLKRRGLIFETNTGNYRWISDPFAYRTTETVVASVCNYFETHPREESHGDESWLKEPAPVTVSDGVQWYHIVVAVMIPYFGLPWGIVNLVRKRRKSGIMMTTISGIFLAIIILINIAASTHAK